MSEARTSDQHLRILNEVAEAASDLKMGYRDPSFAGMSGGVKGLREELFKKVDAWERWVDENATETT